MNVSVGTRRLRVLTTQEAIVPDQIVDSVVVVIDVLLATTTLVSILDAGARRVFAARDLAEVDRICATLVPGELIRGGEHNALPVEGFDCGAYPEEYPSDLVRGRDVVYVSTNGTRAIGRAESAARVLVASLRNAPAVASHLEESDAENVIIACAGSRGGFALEDFTAAGVILDSLGRDWKMNDAAWLALDLVRREPGRTGEILRSSRAGNWFATREMNDVLDFVGDVGASETVAEVRQCELVRVAG